jgi:GNAT superfamily N-acetyltransferase
MPRRAGAEDISTAAGLLARAFAADPLLTMLLGHRRNIVAQLTRYFEVEAALALGGRGELWLDDDRLGAAIWHRPGAWPDAARTPVRAVIAFARIFSRRFLEASKAATALARLHPLEPHWYLPFVGVVPEAAGAGRGSALLAPVLQHSDEQRTGSYLEATSADSAHLFQRLGYVPRDEVVVAKRVVVRPMWREPK